MPKNPWEPKERLEHGYFKSLNEMFKYLFELIKNEVNPFIIAKTLKFAMNNPVIKRFAYQKASKMVTLLSVENAKSWRQAAAKGSKGNIIYKALMQELRGPIGGEVYAQVMRNAGIITTLPIEISESVTEYIARESFKGKRALEIAEEIKTLFPDKTTARAKLIARTEVSKTSTALTRARAESINLPWYEWRTSEDQRVRSSHKHMDKVLIRWKDAPRPEKLIGMHNPPAPYHAGEIYNCRCYPAPVVYAEYVKWPHKVFYGGAIVMMTKKQFEQIM